MVRHRGSYTYLKVLGLSLADQDAIEVKLLVGQLHLWRGHIGAEDHHRLWPVLELDRQLQGPNPVGEPLPVSTGKGLILSTLQSDGKLVHRGARLLLL